MPAHPPLAAPAAVLADAANSVADILARFGVNWQSFGAAVVNFALVAGVLYYFAFRPILKTLDERNAKIADGLRFSDEMKARLADAETAAAARLDAAAAEAAAIGRAAAARAAAYEERAQKDAAAHAADILARAEIKTTQERAQMLETLRAEVAALVVQTTAKILSRELTDAEKTRFNTAAAAEITGQKS
jgi:F-type H+-transporting ATPase subunit b